MKDRGDGDSYIRRVHEDTQRYTHEMLEENRRLRLLAATLEAQRRGAAEALAAASVKLQRIDVIEAELERLRNDSARLEQIADEAAAKLRQREREAGDLARQLEDAEAESQRHLEEFASFEQQNANLANLYVASYRLHSTLDREEVLAAIQEIVINLIGSEELAVYEGESLHTLRPLAQFGIDPDATLLAAAVRARLEKALESGKAWVADAPSPDSVTACVPLTVGGRATGAIVVMRLLEQKRSIEPVDYELFDLLATHAATALYCANLHAEATNTVGATAVEGR
jgi:hypothetical protein